MKYLIYFLFLLLLMPSCSTKDHPGEGSYKVVSGKTMGTYYRVLYNDTLGRDFSTDISGLLADINSEISTYEPQSTVSRFNRSAGPFHTGLNFKDYANCLSDYRTCPKVKNRHFHANFLLAKVACERTRHAFDPTVMPLVNYWGFGYTPKRAVTRVDSLKVDSLRQYVGFDKVKMYDENGYAVISKTNPHIQLDFGGTGQGYGIDAVAGFLENKGIRDYLVDIGGESKARGRNPSGQWWRIGINTPRPDAPVTEYKTVVELRNNAISTSGNYRNFYEVNGKKYSHFISPFTGFPEKSNLLSATVFNEKCTYADALATGFMVLGLNQAFTLAEQLPGVEALFIFSDENGHLQLKYTSGVEGLFLSNSQTLK